MATLQAFPKGSSRNYEQIHEALIARSEENGTAIRLQATDVTAEHQIGSYTVDNGELIYQSNSKRRKGRKARAYLSADVQSDDVALEFVSENSDG
jgi:hypothetical protein